MKISPGPFPFPALAYAGRRGFPLRHRRADGGRVEVGRLRVMNDDRRSRLFRHDLKRLGQLGAEDGCNVEQPPDERVLRQVGARPVPPRVALPALGGKAEFGRGCGGACARRAPLRTGPKSRAGSTPRRIGPRAGARRCARRCRGRRSRPAARPRRSRARLRAAAGNRRGRGDRSPIWRGKVNRPNSRAGSAGS